MAPSTSSGRLCSRRARRKPPSAPAVDAINHCEGSPSWYQDQHGKAAHAHAGIASAVMAAGSDPADSRVAALVEELSTASARFRELWARADVGYRPDVVHVRHPRVGHLHLHSNRFNIPHSGGEHLLIYRAEPGSKSARALELLRPS